MEGSKTSFYCRDDGNKSAYTVAILCMKNGNWSPDPHTYRCDTAEFEVTSKIDLSLHVYKIIILVT